MHYSQTGSELIRLDTENCRVMETVVYLVCIAVASLSVLAQPTVTQGANGGGACGPTNFCCTFNSPPWFNVTLSSPTTDDIKVRICGEEGIGNENTPIQLIKQ